MSMKQSILITGAYGGMGRATAASLRDLGFRVFALDRHVGAAEDGIIPIEADLTEEASVENAFRQVCGQTDELFATRNEVFWRNSTIFSDLFGIRSTI